MLKRATTVVLGLSALGCVLLAATRACYDISFVTPLQLTTSGAEEEALYSIWCYAHGQTVFTNPWHIPYTASYFNWLFYALYGTTCRVVLAAFHLGDAWIPTICRLLTLALTAAGAGFFALALRWSGARPSLSIFEIGSLALLASFNPLCGLWLITARPDMGAVVFELAGTAFFLRYWRDHGWRWIVLTALAYYAAWSFKQVSPTALPAAGLTLLLLRRWPAAVVLGGVWLIAVIVTLAVLGPDYRHGLLGAQAHVTFSIPWSLRQLALAAGKMPFIVSALGTVAWLLARWKRESPPRPPELALLLMLLASFALEVVTASKNGSADYYYIPLAVESPLWLALILPRLSPGWRNGLFAAPALIMLLGLATVLSGLRGTLDNRDPNDHFGHLARYLATRPGPVLVRDTYGDLPWISPTAPHFVIEFNYPADIRAGVSFEAGGVDALIDRGYFSTIVDDPTASPDDEQRLAPHYHLARRDLQMLYFERK